MNTNPTIEAIETSVKALAVGTGLTIKLGYIGNLDGRRDDRLWHVWVYNAREVRTNNVVSLGSATTATLDRLLPLVNEDHLVRVLGRVQWRPSEVKRADLTIETTREESNDLLGDLLAPNAFDVSEPRISI